MFFFMCVPVLGTPGRDDRSKAGGGLWTAKRCREGEHINSRAKNKNRKSKQERENFVVRNLLTTFSPTTYLDFAAQPKMGMAPAKARAKGKRAKGKRGVAFPSGGPRLATPSGNLGKKFCPCDSPKRCFWKSLWYLIFFPRQSSTHVCFHTFYEGIFKHPPPKCQGRSFFI